MEPTTQEPQIWDGEYDKQFYIVHLPSGEKVVCWPNAGFMNANDGSGRMWKPEDKILVSIQPEEESPIPSVVRRNAQKRSIGKSPALLAHLVALGALGMEEELSGPSVIHARGRGLSVDSIETNMRGYARHITNPILGIGDKLQLERARAKRERRNAIRKKNHAQQRKA